MQDTRRPVTSRGYFSILMMLISPVLRTVYSTRTQPPQPRSRVISANRRNFFRERSRGSRNSDVSQPHLGRLDPAQNADFSLGKPKNQREMNKSNNYNYRNISRGSCEVVHNSPDEWARNRMHCYNVHSFVSKI